MDNQREWLFYSFLLILMVGYGAFAMVSWGLQFQAGLLANLLGILAMAVLGGLRMVGVRLSRLITALQVLTLTQAFAITWLTGGIYSATISWLALAPLPAVLASKPRARVAGLAAGWLLILGLYVYALLGGEMAWQIMPQDLIHWHLMMAIVIFGLQLALLFRLNSVRNERMQRTQQQRRQLRQLTKNLQHMQQPPRAAVLLLPRAAHRQVALECSREDLWTGVMGIGLGRELCGMLYSSCFGWTAF